MAKEIDHFLDVSTNIKSTSDIGKQIQNLIASRLIDKLWYDPTYGMQLKTTLRRVDPSAFDVIARACENEILKDERVGTVSVEIEWDGVGTAHVIVVATAADTDQPINLSLPITTI